MTITFQDLALEGNYYPEGDPGGLGVARPGGIFSSADDMYDYLERGGLVHTDDEGNIHVNPCVQVVLYEPYADDEEDSWFQVYINDDY